MQSALQAPPFFIGLISLLSLHLASWFFGYFLIRLSGISPNGKAHGEFTRLLIGYLGFLLVFSVFITAGATIMSGLIIPVLFLIKSGKNWKTGAAPELPSPTTIFTHILFLTFFFTLGYLAIYNPFTGTVVKSNVDQFVYARFCEHMLATGEENIFIDWFLPVAQGNSLYHYGDLWGGCLVAWLSGLNPFYGLSLVSSPFIFVIAAWGALSFLESVGLKNWVILVPLCGLIIFLSPERPLLVWAHSI